MFHASLARILNSIRPAMTKPELARTPDGHYRRIIYSIGPYCYDKDLQTDFYLFYSVY